MENTKRSEFDILTDILRVALNGAKKSHIVYRANLNFEVLRKYMQRLEEAGLIVISPEDNLYETTLKGVEFIKQYNELTNFLNNP